MSLHGRGQFDAEATQPLPVPALPPPRAGQATPPIWAPPSPPRPYGDPYRGYSGSWQGPWSPPTGGWQSPGGGWQPPGGPWPPKPPRRTRAALVVVGVVIAVVVAVVAVSYALAPAGRRQATTARVPGASESPSPADSQPAAIAGSAAPSLSPSPAASVPAALATPSPPGPALSTEAVAAAVDPAVVDINSFMGFQGGTAAGTGMVLTPSGAVLTNNHVIDGAASISVQVAGTSRRYPATVVGKDIPDDVAVIQLAGASDMKTTPFGDSSRVAVGDRVVALGNALGRAGPPSVSQGFVVALNRAITATDPSAGSSEDLTGLIQTNAVLQPGDSGGPLANDAGQVIGMDTAASARMRFNAGSAGYAIPIDKALTIAAQIRAGGFGPASPAPAAPGAGRGFLGIQVQAGSTPGAYVADVVAGSPAELAGMMPGDTVVSVDGATVVSPSSLTSILSSHRPGEKVQVGWVDTAGLAHAASVTLAAAG